MSSNPPRLLFLGTLGSFSRLVLDEVLARGQRVVGIVVPDEAGSTWRPLTPPPPLLTDLPLVPSFVGTSIVERGWASGIPVWAARTFDTPTLRALHSLAPTVLAVACWPARLPDALLTLPPWGCLNVHPSRLPHFRGPAPLFWQLRAGVEQSAVTLHRMSARLDEGDILAQAPVPLPEGATGEALDALMARAGGELLATTLDALETGSARATPQPAGGSYQSWPTADAFTLSPAWSARHAWNFMRGTRDWGQPYRFPLLTGPLLVQQPLAYDPTATLPAPSLPTPDGLALRFSPGVLWVASGSPT